MNQVKSCAKLRIPGYLDRYPAKMVAHLADTLVDDYTEPDSLILDPFCGSGAILMAAKERGLRVCGFDINPYGVLLSDVKLNGFSPDSARKLCHALVEAAKNTVSRFSASWDSIDYWFTPATLSKFERLRYAASKLRLSSSSAGRAVLLAFALSIRRCSRADQRSPKPFISKSARSRRAGIHFDPFKEIPFILEQLCSLYGFSILSKSDVACMDVTKVLSKRRRAFGPISHVITSPPYINAQDYFRNFKLELFLLEGLLPFRIADIQNRFIGTERGNLLADVPDSCLIANRKLLRALISMERTHLRHAAIVHRYLFDMREFVKFSIDVLDETGSFIIVCGDNLVAGYEIPTVKIINRIISENGLQLIERFGDRIGRRYVPPSRLGHKGLIKQEVVSVFKRG